MFGVVSTTGVGLLLLTLQSCHPFSWGFDIGGPDLHICLVVHLGLNRDMAEASIALVLLGYLADIFSGSTSGIHLVTSVLIFLVLQLIQARLALKGVWICTFFAVAAALVASVLVWVLASVFLPEYSASTVLLRFAVQRALLTAPFAMPILLLMDHLDRLGRYGRSRSTLQI